MKPDILSYAEYQKRIKNLRTPEDIAAFTQELIAPAFAGIAQTDSKEGTANDGATIEN